MGEVIEFNLFKRTRDEKGLNNRGVKKNKFYMMIGIPCSGKSYYCKDTYNNSNTIIISTDEIRKEITGSYEYEKDSNNLVFDIAKNRINQFLIDGYNVVFDATNTNSMYRKRILKIAKNNKCKSEALVFMTPIEVCIDRNRKRDIERRVPIDVIINMANFSPRKVEEEGFDEVKYVK